jgi:hypothetical protein
VHLTVAGKDRSGDLGVEVAAAAAQLQASGSVGARRRNILALVLKAAADRAD